MKNYLRISILLFVTVLVFLSGNVKAQVQNANDFAGGKVINPNAKKMKNGNHLLGLAYDTSACGLNYAGARVMITTRYNASAVNTLGHGYPADLNISGIPTGCFTLLKAYIWWDVSYQAGSSDTPMVVLTNPLGVRDSFPAMDIGSDGSKCWGEVGTRTFRADVTSNFGGNGAYVIDTIYGNTVWEVDGASLVLIYQDLNTSYKGSISIWDGTIVIDGGTISQTISCDTVCDTAINARAFMMAADLQDNVATTHQATLNNVVGNYPQNFWNFDDVATTVTIGQSTSIFGVNISSDCYNFCVAGLYYQTTNCTVCTPIGFTYTTSQTPIACGTTNTGTANVTISGGIGPFSYQWSPTGGTASTASNLTQGTYYVVITDSGAGCTAIAVINMVQADVIDPHLNEVPITCNNAANGIAFVNPTGGVNGYTYTWSPSGGNGNTASNLGAGMYTILIVDGNGCYAIDSVNMINPTPMLVTPFVVDETCNGGTNASASVSVSGGTGPYSYTWSPAVGIGASALSITAGNYTVTITDSTGCTATMAFSITQPAPVTIAMSNDTTICAGQPITIHGLAAGGHGPYSYVWNNGVFVNTQTVTPLTTTTYTLIATDANGCPSQTYSITVTVNPSPTVLIVPDTATICFGDSVTLTATGNGSFLWSNGSTNASITVSPLVTTNYIVTITSGGCPGIPDTATVTVLGTGVHAGFTVTPDSGAEPLTVHFTNTSTNGFTYFWNFGDGTTSTDSVPNHIYTQGKYSVLLIVTNEFGCVDSFRFNFVIVESLSSFNVPNVFTPNADGKNDLFMPEMKNIASIDAKIFDRWGLLIYEWTDVTKGWNGNNKNGGSEPDGTYYYLISATGMDGKLYKTTGYLTLIR